MASIDLCKLDDVKDWLSIDLGNTDLDALLTRLIKAVSGKIEKYLLREIKIETRVELSDGHGNPRLMVREFPIVTVNSLKIDGIVIPEAATAQDTGFVISTNKDRDTITLVGGFLNFGLRGTPDQFNRGRQNVEINYDAGLAVDAAGITANVPEIEQAAIEQVSYMFKARGRIGLSTENLAGQQTNYLTTDLLESVKALINVYRRVAPF